jgi:hypothetical protein
MHIKKERRHTHLERKTGRRKAQRETDRQTEARSTLRERGTRFERVRKKKEAQT